MWYEIFDLQQGGIFMGMGVNGITNSNIYSESIIKKTNNVFNSQVAISGETVINGQDNQISAEEKKRKAADFLAQKDKLHAEQMATVMNTITDGMRVAQEISRRMSSGAKVSQADENNLQQYDPRMYQAAKNAQLMAQRKKDMSKESLIDGFVERHKNDRKDWTSELDEKIADLQVEFGDTERQAIANAEAGISGAASSTANSYESIDVTV